MTRKEAEAEARAKVVESAERVAKLLADIQVKLTELREAVAKYVTSPR